MAEYKVCGERRKEEKPMRNVYCETLMELAKKNEDILVFDADLMNSVGLMPFAKAYPERTFDCGIQEANMFGVAAGASTMGKIPFIHSFGTFASRRIVDQIYMSGGFAKTNVRIMGSDPGVTAAYNGGTHMALEDVGCLRSIPEITIIEPTDCAMLKDVVTKTASMHGIFYIRLNRKDVCKIFEEGSTFEIGKSAHVRDGKDVTIIASGLMVEEAMIAAEKLSAMGYEAAIENMFTIKPIDKEAVIRCAKETGAIVTAENHNVIGGLGSAVAEVVVEEAPVPVERVGVNDTFGEVGSVDFLKNKFGLTAEKIVEKALIAIKRKERE